MYSLCKYIKSSKLKCKCAALLGFGDNEYEKQIITNHLIAGIRLNLSYRSFANKARSYEDWHSFSIIYQSTNIHNLSIAANADAEEGIIRGTYKSKSFSGTHHCPVLNMRTSESIH